jgi:hypothetical protein
MAATIYTRCVTILEFASFVLALTLIANIITGNLMMKEPIIEHFKIHNIVQLYENHPSN